MEMKNPLSEEDGAGDEQTQQLVARALEGEKAALHHLVESHQQFVFNIALKMFGARSDAEDLTQEVFVKVITSLKTFRGESSFRTWLYRITVNHFLKTRRRGMERTVDGFESYFDKVASIPDEPMTAEEVEISGQSIADLRVHCTTGMLMCLDRHQRLVFVLGAVFAVPHVLAAEILDLSPSYFRVQLHRARADLYSWMNQRCGLINTANPCRCHKKTKAYVRQGAVDPDRLVFNTDYSLRIKDVVRRGAAGAMATVDDLHEQIFLEHPFGLSRLKIVNELLENPTLKVFFDLS